MIYLLAMDRTTEVGIQACETTEAFLTKRTTIPRSIPGCTSSHTCRFVLICIPTNLLVGEYMIWIDFAAVLVDLLTVDAGVAGA